MSSQATHCSYRPLTVFSYTLTSHFSPLTFSDPPPGLEWRVPNLLLHSANTLLTFLTTLSLWKLAQHLTGVHTGHSLKSSYVAALLFAVHPVHADALGQLVGRAELLATFFALISFNAHLQAIISPTTSHRSSPLLVLVVLLFTTASLLSKETGLLTLPASLVIDIFSAYTSRRGKPVPTSSLARITTLSAAIPLILAYRFSLCSHGAPTFARHLNPIPHLPSRRNRALSIMHIWAFNLRLLVFPLALSHDWNGNSIPPLLSLSDPRLVPTLIVLLLVSLALLHVLSKPSTTSLVALPAILLSLLTYLPSSHLLLRVGFVAAERTLYLPSVGFCALLSLLLAQARRPLIAITILILATRTYYRARDFATAESLMASGAKYNPLNEKMWAELGRLQLGTGNLEPGLTYLNRAVEINPNYVEALTNRGVLQFENDVLDAAVVDFDQVLSIFDDGVETIYGAEQRNQNRVLGYSFIATYRAGAHSWKGQVLWENKQYEEALLEWVKSDALVPNFANVRFAQSRALSELGRFDEEADVLRSLLEIEPNHEQALRALTQTIDVTVNGSVLAMSLHPNSDPANTVAAFCRTHSINSEQCHTMHETLTKTPPVGASYGKVFALDVAGDEEGVAVDEEACVYFLHAEATPYLCQALPIREDMMLAEFRGKQLVYVARQSDNEIVHATFLNIADPRIVLRDYAARQPTDETVYLEGTVEVTGFHSDGEVCLYLLMPTGHVSVCVEGVGDGVVEIRGTVARNVGDGTAHIIGVLKEANTLRVAADTEWGRGHLQALGGEGRKVVGGLGEAGEWGLFSQNGEDGILDLIFGKVGVTNRFYVEFGVEDGSECNSRFLREVRGWSGLAMDGGLHLSSPIPVEQELVTKENIVSLLVKHNVPAEMDLLSVDIVYNGFWVLMEILESGYRPRVVVAEINSHLGAEEAKTVVYEQEGGWDGRTDYSGASLLGMSKLLAAWGYRLVYCESHGVNCLWLREDVGDVAEGGQEEGVEARAKRLFREPNHFGKGCEDNNTTSEHDEVREWVVVQ